MHVKHIFLIFFTNNYCFNLNNLQDSSQTWKLRGGGHYIKDTEVSKGTVVLNTVSFLMWTYARVLYYTFCNTYISIFIAPFGDTVRTRIFQAAFMYPGRRMKMQKTWTRLTRQKDHAVFNIKNPKWSHVYFFFHKNKTT